MEASITHQDHHGGLHHPSRAQFTAHHPSPDHHDCLVGGSIKRMTNLKSYLRILTTRPRSNVDSRVPGKNDSKFNNNSFQKQKVTSGKFKVDTEDLLCLSFVGFEPARPGWEAIVLTLIPRRHDRFICSRILQQYTAVD